MMSEKMKLSSQSLTKKHLFVSKTSRELKLFPKTSVAPMVIICRGSLTVKVNRLLTLLEP